MCFRLQMAAVVKEWLPEEIAEFSPKFWPSDSLYLDEDRAFFKAVNGGEEHSISLLSFLNPFRCAPSHAFLHGPCACATPFQVGEIPWWRALCMALPGRLLLLASRNVLHYII